MQGRYLGFSSYLALGGEKITRLGLTLLVHEGRLALSVAEALGNHWRTFAEERLASCRRTTSNLTPRTTSKRARPIGTLAT